ncbi:glycosyltransferase [Flavobacterium sp. XS1P32]|uniref:glycosyltransferase n=1 Tax=unclassified Flavobacterium TaxID=196869 RepID=UPI003AAB930B
MNEVNKIVFKVPEFPHISETFIIAQLVTAIELGYVIEIVTRKIVNKNSLMASAIGKYKLLDSVIIEDYKIPKNKGVRLLRWFLLLLTNLYHLRSIINFHREFAKFSLSWLYQWHFYFQFNEAAIIHVQYGTNSYPYRVINHKNIFKPKVIVTFHGHDAFFPIYGNIQNNGYYKKLFTNSTLITANTPYLGNQLIELGCLAEMLKIVPVGVDTEFFTPAKNYRETREVLKLITVGRLDKVKGHLYCIEVVNELVQKGLNVSLTIIGEGSERLALETLIQQYRLEKYILLLASKNAQEIRNELQAHDIYLLLAVPVDFERRESQGLATIEAQACGLPAIVFDSGGVKYTVQNEYSGFICGEFDTTAVVGKIELLYQNRLLLKKMGTQATLFVKTEYALHIIQEKWAFIYKNIIS